MPWEYPTSLDQNTGAIDAGALSSVWADDDSFLTLTETTEIPAFSYDFNFENVPGTDYKLILNGYYNGSSDHRVKIQQYNFTTDQWVNVTTDSADLEYAASEQAYEFTLLNSEDYVMGGLLQIRILHLGYGTATHKLYIDEIKLEAV